MGFSLNLRDRACLDNEAARRPRHHFAGGPGPPLCDKSLLERIDVLQHTPAAASIELAQDVIKEDYGSSPRGAGGSCRFGQASKAAGRCCAREANESAGMPSISTWTSSR
ncbi:hypothetical protein [Candidatus Amarobacter glycogenicus]|uniref:hypothetical protein n=1 Tax=Candidatus Amarobacter glycogenicus TaxID=3140699 RepID=UPI0031373B77|nr:hypothetical protein [Dehalococcoidia bacterium]